MMLWMLDLDFVFLHSSPFVANELVRAGQAVEDPPIRSGGYRIVDREEEDRLYRLYQARAYSLARQRGRGRY